MDTKNCIILTCAVLGLLILYIMLRSKFTDCQVDNRDYPQGNIPAEKYLVPQRTPQQLSNFVMNGQL